MDLFRLRDDLPRAILDGYVFPLGIVPVPGLVPRQGWSMNWTTGEGELGDCCTFHVVQSLDRLAVLLDAFFLLLPERGLYGILELGSRDAYRAVDVYIGDDGMDRDRFMEIWRLYEPIFLEDAGLAVGVNAEDPFIELFLDPDKGMLVHVDPCLQEDVRSILLGQDVQEVPAVGYELEDHELDRIGIRPVLVQADGLICDVDQLLQDLKYEWHLALNEDPTTNIDGRGRRIGRTLWHAVVILDTDSGDLVREAHATIWGTATSRSEMEELIELRLQRETPWRMQEIYVLDRAAFDDRPVELDALAPVPELSSIHLVQIDPLDGTRPTGGAPRHG